MKIVKELVERLFGNLNKEEFDFIDIFYNEKRLALDRIGREDLNPAIDHHPSILWALKKRRE